MFYSEREEQQEIKKGKLNHKSGIYLSSWDKHI